MFTPGSRGLLSLGVRALTLIHFNVAQALQQADETITGISEAYPSQTTNRPSAALILGAFTAITVTIIRQAGQRVVHVPALSAVQQKLLHLLGLPADLYARIATTMNSPNINSAFSER